MASLGSQKHHMAVYLMTADVDMTAWLRRREFAARGKKLSMGKCCSRVKRVEDLPLDVIGKAIGRVSVEEYIQGVEASLSRRWTIFRGE